MANVVSGDGKSAKAQVLFGKLAIEWMYATTLVKLNSGTVALPEEMKDLRAFQWMLSKEQELVVGEWFKRAVRLLRSKHGTQCIKDGATPAVLDIDLTICAPNPEVSIDPSSASSSDTKGSKEGVTTPTVHNTKALAPAPTAKAVIKATKAAMLADEPKLAMAALFGGKATVKTKC
mgnify:CR=1 FL=1